MGIYRQSGPSEKFALTTKGPRNRLLARMTAQGEADNLSQQLPKLRFGFGMAIALFILEIVSGTQKELARGTPESQSAGGFAAALTVMGAIVSTAYVLHCISTYHYVLRQVEGWRHPISPKRAVRFHFIPVFNLYWDFKWPKEIATFVNWRMQRRRMSGVLVGALVLLGFLIAGFLDVSIGLVLILSAFAYISRCLRDALAAPAIPRELHVTSGLDAASPVNWAR
jgi:hypothetical protein